MKWNRKILILTIIWLTALLWNTPALYAADVRIVDYAYSTHFRPGELVTFNVKVQNNEAVVVNNLYINVVLTKRSDSTEVVPYPSTAVFSVAAGSASSFTTTANNWTATEGLYTITILLYNRT